MKHPVLESRGHLIIWWLVWLFLALSQALLFYFAYGSFVDISITDSIVSLVIYSGIALSIWYPFSIFIKGKVKPVAMALNIALAGVLSLFLWLFVTKTLMTLILPDKERYIEYWDATFTYRLATGVFIYGLIILTYFLFVNIFNLSEKKAREAKLESLVRETELKMLRSQINPHFLFNSLNSISSLTITDPEKARTMIIKLSDFMRYALSRKDEQTVTLTSELENLRLYLDIEKVRFGSRLLTLEYIDNKCLEVKIPVMLLQPVYENAVKHGVHESTENVTIVTKASCSGELLLISISNNFQNSISSSKGTGTGLLNVSRRLELTYGNRASVRIDKADGVFTVNIYIPV